jgi:hypothetical protein
MVQTPTTESNPASVFGIANAMESGPGFTSASMIAWRNDPGPLSSVLSTIMVAEGAPTGPPLPNAPWRAIVEIKRRLFFITLFPRSILDVLRR